PAGGARRVEVHRGVEAGDRPFHSGLGGLQRLGGSVLVGGRALLEDDAAIGEEHDQRDPYQQHHRHHERDGAALMAHHRKVHGGAPHVMMGGQTPTMLSARIRIVSCSVLVTAASLASWPVIEIMISRTVTTGNVPPPTTQLTLIDAGAAATF